MCYVRNLCLLWAGLALPVCAQTAATKRSISLEESIELAVQHNLELKIERLNPKIAWDQLESSDSIYDPTLSFSTGTGYKSFTPSFNPNLGGQFFGASSTHTDSLESDLSGSGPYGSTYSFKAPFSRNYGAGFASAAGRGFDTYSGDLQLAVAIPLLKNAAIDQPRWTILVNRNALKRSEYGLRNQLINIISSVRTAYYNLIAAQETVKVQERALELATRLYEDNRAKVRAGALPPLDEKQAESQVAVTRADLISAQQSVTSAQNALKGLLSDNLPEWRTTDLVPTEQLLAVAQLMDVQESWQRGLSQRPDLSQLRIDVERSAIDMRYYNNQTKPDLSLIGNYSQAAFETESTKVAGNVFKPEYDSWFGGARITFPWSNKYARYRYQASRDAHTQAELFVQKLERDVMVQIDNAISLARSSFDRVKATRQAREYAEMALDAEQKKLSNGKSTSYTVLLFQRDLTNARSAEITALADYNKALVSVDQTEGSTLAKLKISLEIR